MSLEPPINDLEIQNLSSAEKLPATTTTPPSAQRPLRKTARLSTEAIENELTAEETDTDILPVTPMQPNRRRSSIRSQRRRVNMLLTPVRASQKEKESLGADVLFTPVRRSTRTVC